MIEKVKTVIYWI